MVDVDVSIEVATRVLRVETPGREEGIHGHGCAASRGEEAPRVVDGTLSCTGDMNEPLVRPWGTPDSLPQQHRPHGGSAGAELLERL